MKAKAQTISYFTPASVRFTAAQMEAIIVDNMETWSLTREQAEACNVEDILLAASRLDLFEMPSEIRFDE